VLQVTDVDNTPAQLVYTLVAAPNPTFGQLQLNGVGLITGQTFTQADIDAGRVTYRSTGGGSSDTFQVSISDGGPGGTLPTEFVTIFFTYP
jgi:VCBS repeat-containing protein